MLFSVLIPVYNVERYLPMCLASVEKQSFGDFEVIIIDDGSEDGGGESCDTFLCSTSVKTTVVHKKNEGLIAARRDAISRAKGEWCVFLDSDDFLHTECLSVLSRKLEEHDYPDMIIYRFCYYTDGVVSECKYKSYGDERIFTREDRGELYKTILTGTELDSLFTKAIKTSLLKADDTDYSRYFKYNMSEDLLQSLYPVTYAERILYINTVLYFYRYNDKSISRDFSPQTVREKSIWHVYREILRYLPVWGLDTDEWRSKLDANFIRQTVHTFIHTVSRSRTRKERLLVAQLFAEQITSSPLNEREAQNPHVPSAYGKIYGHLCAGRYTRALQLRRGIILKKRIKAVKSRISAVCKK